MWKINIKGENKMILYTKNACPKCIFIKNELNRNEIQYEMINIDEVKEAKEKLIDAGFMGMPIIELDDGQLIGNYDEIQIIAQKG